MPCVLRVCWLILYARLMLVCARVTSRRGFSQSAPTKPGAWRHEPMSPGPMETHTPHVNMAVELALSPTNEFKGWSEASGLVLEHINKLEHRIHVVLFRKKNVRFDKSQASTELKHLFGHRDINHPHVLSSFSTPFTHSPKYIRYTSTSSANNHNPLRSYNAFWTCTVMMLQRQSLF